MASIKQCTSMSPAVQKVRIVCISDTHNHGPGEGYTLPKGDILIHAGDLTNQGSLKEVRKAVDWLETAEFSVKIVIAGNHDLALDADYSLKHAEGWKVISEDPKESRSIIESTEAFTYLKHSAATVGIPSKAIQLRVFGSPYSPDRGGQNWAFQYSQDQAEDIWSAIPDCVDVLVTHTPPAGHCDTSKHWTEGGCPALLERLWRVRPMLHICGHCHEGRGAEVIHWGEKPGAIDNVRKWDDLAAGSKKQSLLDLTSSSDMAVEVGKETAVINASIMAKSFGRGAKAFNKPIVIDVEVPARETTPLTANG